MGFDTNEISVNSKGGTELLRMELEERLPVDLVEEFQIISSRVREIQEDKIRIYWLHDLPEDPEASHLKNSDSRDRFHQLVFCSNWQYTRYRDYLGVPHDDKSIVIENGIQPIPLHDKEKNEIRLIYFSTPQRGLELLVPVFEELCKKYDNLVLDVYSSFSIYGWHDADKRFEALFDKCKNHPKINYHGARPYAEVREALKKAHIFAYPSIWAETSCRCLIESMSAELLCVHPNYGALADTSGGLNMMYQWDYRADKHAQIFHGTLENAIEIVHSREVEEYTKLTKIYADTRFSWDKLADQWKNLLISLRNRYPTIESRKFAGPTFNYKVL
jgi:UDP-glucose:(glucosyl)LPS alpha-1,2-glucosyltransferase